ncbi:putative Zinc finger, PHD-type, Zinc finger, FYVE/PHD-type, Zinc finger, RING/FYVE/PHD-type [Plasmopara halstedii]
MPAKASGSSLVTRTRAHQALSQAAHSRPFRVGSDGLPLLPCHDAPVCTVPTSSPSPPAVALFGHVDTKQNVRAQLLAQYSRSQQLEQVNEMTLRIDTELELLRRSCFAARNALWANVTPDEFEFQPVPSDTWTPQPANDKLSLRKMKINGALDGSGREFYPPIKTHVKEVEAVEYVRDRPWPPQEYALKPVAKPMRGRGGKRKAAPMAAVLEPMPLLARTCRECKTQSTPLWRTHTKTVKIRKHVLKENAFKNVATDLANAFVAQNMAMMTPQMLELKTVNEKIDVDVCLACSLKLKRADLFDKKRLEKKRRERQKKGHVASAAVGEKKRNRQQISLKKHKKQEVSTQQGNGTDREIEDEKKDSSTPVVMLKFSKEEIKAATGSSRERLENRKHSRKDKKKKKKHRRKREQVDDTECDYATLNPSSEQINGHEYAEGAVESGITSQDLALEDDASTRLKALKVDAEPEPIESGFQEEEEEVAVPARSSSRKRKSVQYTESPAVVETSVSASKKRRTSLSRTSRSTRAASAAAAPAADTPASTGIKRSRSKKELTRERELRARGQYCPVCNEVYEDDDQSTFICCDSCELWVHGACDPSLSAELIAAMAKTEDKYICPLCAGR